MAAGRELARLSCPTCGDKDLVERLNEVVPPLTELSRQLVTKETEARNLRNQANYEQSEAQLATREPNVEYHKEEAKRCNAEAKQLESELPALRRQVAELERQERAIREAMLTP